MGNYREHASKGLCLVNALLFTLVFVLSFVRNFLILGLTFDRVIIACYIVMILCCAVHWYRYLAYDKKRLEENNHE